MKKLILINCLLLCAINSFAQDKELEAEIRNLEQLEVQAVLAKDTSILKKLWDEEYVVNNPQNEIVLAERNPVDRPVLQQRRTFFKREVEKIIINDNVAISMGRETVESTKESVQSDQIVERRYTNIWMKKNGFWKLVARHANKICQ